MPINPRYFRFVSVFSLVILFGNVVISLYPTAITLSALFAISKFCFLISALFVISHLSINISGAPFVITIYLFPFLCIVVIIFLVESNGISAILCICSSVVLLFIPISNAFSTIAFSVGSPITLWFCVISQSVQSVAYSIIFFSSVVFVSTTFILFCVSVPVLSEQITLLLPNVSTAGSFLIMLFFLDIFVTPIDSTIVTIAGNPSGIAATANPTDVINISIGSIFFIIPIKKISMHIAKHAIPNIFPTCPNFFWIGVSGASFSIIIFAIFPTVVLIPVSVTTAFACPFTTVLAINAMFFMSPNCSSLLHI